MKLEPTRCKYSQRGKGIYKKQRFGYIVGIGNKGGLRVLWDGVKKEQTCSQEHITSLKVLNLM